MTKMGKGVKKPAEATKELAYCLLYSNQVYEDDIVLASSAKNTHLN